MPRLDPAAANAPGLRVRERGRDIQRRSSRCLVIEIMEARLGGELGVHAETLVRTQQLGDVAVGIFNIAKMQCVRDAGIDASRRRARIAAWRQTVLDAEIDAIGTERAFLCDPETRGILAFNLVLHPLVPIGEVLLGDFEAAPCRGTPARASRPRRGRGAGRRRAPWLRARSRRTETGSAGCP